MIGSKIYSYVVRYDTGFAPNPFWGYCTLATCKPDIRRNASERDWVIGTGSVENVGNNRLIYAMKIAKVMRLEDYGRDKRFSKKIPGSGARRRVGDNIYYRDQNGVIRQRFPSIHSFPDKENEESKEHDLKGENVLISSTDSFYYFGRKAPKIPQSLSYLIKEGPKHKCNFSQREIQEFLEWIQKRKTGINGYPFGFPVQPNENAKSRNACK